MSPLVVNILALIDSLPQNAREQLDAELLRRRQSALGKRGGGAVGDSDYYKELSLKAVAARRRKAAQKR